MPLWVVLMVDKMIKYTKIEIFLVIVFLIFSIPLWNYLKNELDSNYTLAIEDATSLDLYLNNVDGYDNVIVSNSILELKKYRLLLVSDKNIDGSTITINNIKYKLSNYIKEDNNYIYILTTNSVKGTRNGYKIDLDLQNKNVNYYYTLEELTDF